MFNLFWVGVFTFYAVLLLWAFWRATVADLEAREALSEALEAINE